MHRYVLYINWLHYDNHIVLPTFYTSWVTITAGPPRNEAHP